MKIKIIFLLFFAFFTKNVFAQNLLLNGDFEEVVPNKGDYQVYLDTFYAKHWYQPTDCSVDIYRDHKVCNSSNVMSITSALQFCLRCASGNYCIGLYGISNFADIKTRIILFRKKFFFLLLIIVSAFLVFVPQFVYWKIATGHFFYYSTTRKPRRRKRRY